MSYPLSNRRAPLRAASLLIAIVAAPAACTINLAGIPSSGSGGGVGSTSTSTSSATSGSGGGTSTSSSASSGTGGMMPACEPGTTAPCYDGPDGTEATGLCKAGTKTCKMDGSGYDSCVGEVTPQPENCFVDGDESCDGMELKCTGATLFSGQVMSPTTNDEAIFAVAADSANNILLGGVVNSTVNGGIVVTSGIGAVAKVAPTGGLPKWVRTLLTVGGHSAVRGVAADKADNVYAVGEFQGPMDDGDLMLSNAGGNDIFLVKLNAMTGAPLCQNVFGDDKNQLGTAVAVDAMGNVFITGSMEGTADFGGGTLTAKGGANVFVAKLDKDCNHVWSKHFVGDAPSVGYGVAATPDGDVVVVGGFQGNLDFGKGNMKSAGGDDIFVAKLAAADGAALWSNRFGDGKDQDAYAVAVGSDGNVAITGTMFGKFNIGADPALDAHASADVFVARFHPDGTTDWSHNYGSDMEYQAAFGVAIDAEQHLVVTGFFKGDITFGATKLTEVAPSMANKLYTDMFVAKLAPDGTSGWALGFGDANDQRAWAVTADHLDNVIVGGTFDGAINFGPPPNQFNNAGGYDGFWVKLAP